MTKFRFLIAAYGSAFRPLIDWVEDEENIITNEALHQQFGPLGAEPVHVALLALAEHDTTHR